MHDNNSHEQDGIVYVDENIPGPEDQTNEYISLIEKFNSQLTHNCDCNVKCKEDCCNCLQISGGANYTSHIESQYLETFKIKEATGLHCYPIIECSQHCKCSEKCGNRVVQKGPIDTLFVKTCDNILKGLGLFTREFIRKGTFVCEYAGEVITKSEALRRQTYNQTHSKMNYIFCLNEHVNGNIIQTFVDPSLFGNIGRYINHSCESNCVIIPVRVDSPIPKLALFSCVDICANGEITFDYGSSYLTSSTESISKNLNERKICLCRSPKCRGFMPYDIY
ncbi:histone-lysine N-methyltransferase SETMAR-like [Vanessa atalanta]|uniref:histone-lysine N-methyltransferase SETMAR-like n=1 Tax=Vanessa atalanta TaxID=42275 RepID=UPI001FCD2420|nr:histone-lysine N-methyltransferase SETMAR-like [Vanessa atalanta]